MRIVIIESPFSGHSPDQEKRHVEYARAALRDCLLRGEAPFASHLLYTQPGVLNDKVSDDRTLGMQAGFAFREVADATVVYTDLGTSVGMQMGIADSNIKGIPIEFRSIEGWSHDKDDFIAA